MRQPIAINKYYPNGITLLDHAFDELFNHEKGPGAYPAIGVGDQQDKVKGLIVPHAPYTLAGPCMAWAYKALAEAKQDSDLFIIVAQAQHSAAAGTTMQTFALPYAEVRVDQHFVRDLVGKGNIVLNDELHNSEENIEIQLPFLQFIYKNHLEKIKIVPIFVNAETAIDELSVDIKEVLLEQNKKATILFVSNFTSYGREFRYVPFTEHIEENITKIDKQLFDAIITHNKKLFLEKVEEHMIPLSGFSALLLFFQLFSPKKVYLEQYYLSGDINDNFNNTVSYASFVIK